MIIEYKNSQLELKENFSLANYTSWKVGGEAEFYLAPKSQQEIVTAIGYCQENNIPITVIGGGYNILVSNQGVQGLLIRMSAAFSEINFSNNIVTASAGLRVGALVYKTTIQKLSGLERLCGIPGTVGGIIYMNAGAYGSETKDRLTEVKSIDKVGNIITRKRNEIDFDYRYSSYQNYDEVILEGSFSLEKGSREESQKLISELNENRKSKQLVRYPNCGSVFKNPEGDFAGRLIEVSGCKGLRIGNAQVSEVHSNFIVNLGNAQSDDFINLIRTVQEKVKSETGILLHNEVRMIGNHGIDLLK